MSCNSSSGSLYFLNILYAIPIISCLFLIISIIYKLVFEFFIISFFFVLIPVLYITFLKIKIENEDEYHTKNQNHKNNKKRNP